MSGQEANEWSIKTMKVNLAGIKRFDDSTTVTHKLDEVAIFVMGGGGFTSTVEIFEYIRIIFYLL